MAEQEEDFSSLPLTERWVHKNWKVRKEAYEAGSKAFAGALSESDAIVRQFVNEPNLWKSAVSDSHIAAHQDGLGALCSFLNICGVQGCTRCVNTTWTRAC
jgi:protein STU2